jgi:hypothetical protein
LKELVHHGFCKGEFEPEYCGTDYFTWRHKPCIEKGSWHGHARITTVLIDNDGRVIFNLECRDCGATDALKTHPELWISERKKPTPLKKLFHLSPKLRKCCSPHEWDNE